MTAPTPDCMPCLLSKKNVEMLTRHKVFSETELKSRYEIMLENYTKTVNIEALTMADMAKKQIIPAVEGYTKELSDAVTSKKAACPELTCGYEKEMIKKLSVLTDQMASRTSELEAITMKLQTMGDVLSEAELIRDEVLPKMSELRAVADEAETITPEKEWPFPTYGDLLFGVR